jgi:hypothetical protein
MFPPPKQGFCCKAFAARLLLQAFCCKAFAGWSFWRMTRHRRKPLGKAVPGERFELPTNGLQNRLYRSVKPLVLTRFFPER